MKLLKKLFGLDQEISTFSIVIFLVTIFGALWVRVYGLSEYAFNEDELWHLTVADQKSLWDVIQYNFQEEIHPPLSYIIWHFMLQISRNDLWLRMSGIVPAILLIPSIYLFGRLYIGRVAGYFLALLFAFGVMPVAISTAIRAYSLMMLALTWAAIFVHKYRFETAEKLRKKYLILYSLCALIAIELNHAACFTLFAFGLILIFQTFKEKNKKDFLIISAIHLGLASLLAVYAYILKTYYGFEGIPGFFTIEKCREYLLYYLTLFLSFAIGYEFQDSITIAVVLVAIPAFFSVPFILARKSNWTLLSIIFVPLTALIFCDYFKLYPFSIIGRNNLFLFLGIAITYAYFVEIWVNFYCQISTSNWLNSRKKTVIFLQKFAALILVILVFSYSLNHDAFRKIIPGCIESNIKKSDIELLNKLLSQKNTADNVFVTVTRNVWYWRLQSGDKNHITILTKNLAKFENDEITIYFTAFPATVFSVTSSMLQYQLFFEDLFKYLNEKDALKKVKSFTFFDTGLRYEYLTRSFHPQFIPTKEKESLMCRDDSLNKLLKESYEISWAINTSKQVLDKVFVRDVKSACGREVLVFSFTPQFVREEILAKNFIDNTKHERCLKK